jgi:hypothetical protein
VPTAVELARFQRRRDTESLLTNLGSLKLFVLTALNYSGHKVIFNINLFRINNWCIFFLIMINF